MALTKLPNPPPTNDPVLREYMQKQKQAIDELQRLILLLAAIEGLAT
jgi:hypothetical protein